MREQPGSVAPGDRAVCFFVEAVGNGFDGVRQDAVVIGDDERQSRLHS